MSTWIAFLRAINLGSTRKYPMGELRSALTDAGFTDVETHINTGNVRFGARMRSRERIEAKLRETMLADRGFEVPVVLLTPAELVAIRDEAMRLAGQRTYDSQHVTLLAQPADPSVRAQIEAGSSDTETVRVGERAVHLLLDKGYHEVRHSNASLEKRLGVATTRNLRVITALADKWGTGTGR